MSWRKLESSSRPGRFYYYNTVTKESTWSEPPGFRSKVVSEDASKHAEGRYSGEGAQALLQSDEADNEEEMECERWAEDEEVGMDVELSMEAEQELLSEITLTRSNICLESSLPTLHPSSTPEYTVRVTPQHLSLYVDINYWFCCCCRICYIWSWIPIFSWLISSSWWS